MPHEEQDGLAVGSGQASPVSQPAAGPQSLEKHSGGAEGNRYRAYQDDVSAPYVGCSLLEVGSGLGHFSQQFADRLEYLAVSDNDQYCLSQLKARYDGRDDVDVLELALPGRVNVRRAVDTVVMMNVLEHIADDVGALRDLASCVEPGGRVVVWVPGYMALYGQFDREVGHCRRYTPTTLSRAIDSAGLRIEVCKPVNFLGGIAWWLTVRRLGVAHLNPRLASLYDVMVVPITKVPTRHFHPPLRQPRLGLARVPKACLT